jgi:hypothetical protein
MLNHFLCGDPFLTFDPTPKVLFGRANLPPAPTHHQHQQLEAQPQHQIEEEPTVPNPLEYPGLLTPPSTEATTSGASSSTQSISLPSSPTIDSVSWSDNRQGFEQDLWDPEHDTTQTTAEQTSSPSPTPSPPASPQPETSKQYLNQEIARQSSTEGGKSLRSGKVTFADPVKARSWAAAAKSKLASLTHKPPKSTEASIQAFFNQTAHTKFTVPKITQFYGQTISSGKIFRGGEKSQFTHCHTK